MFGLLAAVACGIFLALCIEAKSTAASSGPDLVQAERSGVLTRIAVYVQTQQRQFHRELVASVRAAQSDPTAAAAWTLITISFVYGLFHAAGPGHGKAVISSYLLTHERQVGRGLAIAVASAFVQGGVAIALVIGGATLLGMGRRDTFAAAQALERGSFALVVLLGLGLLLRAVLRMLQILRTRREEAHVHALGTEHHHGHGDGCCGHSHGPTYAQVEAASSWRSTLTVILSIGARPCTGAVLVLIVAEMLGMRLVGALAALAMSAGTAAAVCALALIAVAMRRMAVTVVEGDGRQFTLFGHAVAAFGGFLIALIGGVLFAGSFQGPHPLFS